MTQDQQHDKPGRYRKRPVVIEAAQWFKMGDHPAVCMVKDYLANGGRGEESPGIDTLEGKLRVSPGDWIITGVKGEHYACKPDIFAATYEPANAPLPETGALDALRELVTLKNLKDALDGIEAVSELGAELHQQRLAEYQRRKPLAWERARAVVAGTNNAAGQVSPAQESRESDGKGSALPAPAAPTSDTQRTDFALTVASTVDLNTAFDDLTVLARQLERELAEAKALYLESARKNVTLMVDSLGAPASAKPLISPGAINDSLASTSGAQASKCDAHPDYPVSARCCLNGCQDFARSTSGTSLDDMPTDAEVKAICDWMAWPYADKKMRRDASELWSAIRTARSATQERK